MRKYERFKIKKKNEQEPYPIRQKTKSRWSGEPYHPYLLKNRSAKSLEKLKSDPCLCSSKFKSLILIIITYIYSHYLFIYYIIF